ncbi:MAG: hypothetical protein M2R46_05537 [Verrucomicrobia subdivision 3 bacterium]|nr:hypothetical protein [Limisphaerales bacterium]
MIFAQLLLTQSLPNPPIETKNGQGQTHPADQIRHGFFRFSLSPLSPLKVFVDLFGLVRIAASRPLKLISQGVALSFNVFFLLLKCLQLFLIPLYLGVQLFLISNFRVEFLRLLGQSLLPSKLLMQSG